MYFVYAIKRIQRKYIYIGITDNPKRKKQHNKGYEKTTKPNNPFKLILLEDFNSRPDARKREKYLNSGFGKEFHYSI